MGKALIGKAFSDLPASCPHAYPQLAGTTMMRRGAGWAIFDHRLHVDDSIGDFQAAPRLSS
ncbi:hypothetical protein, partial [Bordetella bronchiseptica]|uniref:hypothetical protein n=1 Tax=Bordetella bronchiseptica TaxID=518 RepID=UPI001F281469